MLKHDSRRRVLKLIPQLSSDAHMRKNELFMDHFLDLLLQDATILLREQISSRRPVITATASSSDRVSGQGR